MKRGCRMKTASATLVALAIAAAPAAAQSPVRDTIEQVPAFIEKGDYQGAIENLKLVEPEAEGAAKATVRNALGYTQFLSGDYDQAARNLASAKDLAEAAGDEQTRIKALNNRGVLEFTRGDLEAAAAAFEEATASGSEFARNYLGQIDLQRQAEAARALIDAGVRARMTDDFATAVASYDQALALDPNNVQALDYRGYALFRLGDLDRAEQDFVRALELQPDAVIPKLNLLKVRCSDPASSAAELLALAPQTERERELYRRETELRRVCGKRLDPLLGG